MNYRRLVERSMLGAYVLSTVSLTSSIAFIHTGERRARPPQRLAELPQEILEAIIDLFSDDEETLRTCALVARSWTQRARHHLFGHLDLDLKKWNSPPRLSYNVTKSFSDFRARRLATLHEALNRSPDLAPTVHTLTLNPGSYTHSNDSQDGNGLVARELARIIPLLTGVRVLYIALPGKWRLYFPDMQSACLGLLALPTLDSISFSQGFFQSKFDLTEVIGRPRGPRILHLAGLQLEPIEKWESREEVGRRTGNPLPKDPVRLPPVSQLRELHLDCMLDELVEWLCMNEINSIPLSKVAITQGISVSWQSVQTLLNLAGSHLEELEVASESYAWDAPRKSPSQLRFLSADNNSSKKPLPTAPIPGSPLNLDGCPNLRSIQVHSLESTEMYSPIPWLLSLFGGVSSPTSIESITLDLHAFAVHGGSSIVGDAYWRDWRELDNLLAGPLFPRLQAVGIALSVTKGFGSVIDEQHHLEQALPKLGSRKGTKREVVPRESLAELVPPILSSDSDSDSTFSDWDSSDSD